MQFPITARPSFWQTVVARSMSLLLEGSNSLGKEQKDDSLILARASPLDSFAGALESGDPHQHWVALSAIESVVAVPKVALVVESRC